MSKLVGQASLELESLAYAELVQKESFFFQKNESR